MKTSRRDFLKISAMGIGAASLSGGVAKAAGKSMFSKDQINKLMTKRTATYCEVCFWKCAGWVYSDNEGNVNKVIGHPDDPHCNGRFCPRGTGGVGMYNDEDRLKTPLIRVTDEAGRQSYKEASWDEAFNVIAKNMKKIAKEYGPECMALFTHGSGGKFWGHLLKAYGSKNIAAPSYAQCRGPREVAWIGTFGEGLGSPEPTDIRDTKCLVLIGSHIGENMHNGQVQEMSDAIDKDATIITVDPRFSTAASHSKYWLPIKPATDIALLLAWIHVLINEGWYDKDYVEKNTYGFDQLKNHVKNNTPEWAYGITTIKPDVIRKTAREMFNASPAVIIHPGRHVTWYGDDTQRLRAVAILNALLGSWGRRGGFYVGDGIGIPSYPHPAYPKPTRTWRDAMPGKFNLADYALANGVCDATIPGIEGNCSIKGWIVNGTNLIFTLPDVEKTKKAIQNLEFLVVVDTMPMEITGYADVVLPECTYLERYDHIRTSKHRIPTIALREPAAEPKYNSKPGWWMAKQLGHKLGLDAYFKYDDNEDLEFFTNTGKIELYATAFAEEGFDPMPKYTAHPEPPKGFYRLNYGRAPMHTFSRTANNPNLTDLMDENSVWVNPKVAKVWSLKNDQYVWLENQDGIVSTFPIKVRITERIRWDSVYMVHGFGHKNEKLTRAHGRGASDSELITNVMVDPIMGGTGMRGNFVTFHTNKPEKGGLL
jgi:thiosulfate reductase/polysulfide reductase chain A